MTRTVRIASIAAAALAVAFFIGMRFMQADEPTTLTPAKEANLFPFVRSMDGTRPDGELQVSEGGELVANEELVRLFDYYLAAIGEKSLDEIRTGIERELDVRLKPGPAKDAKLLLGRYLDYKRALAEVEKNAQHAGASIDAMRARMDDMQQARRRFFSDKEIQAMFGFQDAYDIDAVARLEISQDAKLTPEQKREKLAALDSNLPPAVREAKEAPFQVVRLEESVQKMRTQGASDDEVYRMRAAAISPEAAARLAQVDTEERSWNARIAAYLAERSKVLAGGATLSEADRATRIAELRQASFTADEQRRLPAYEGSN